MLRFVKDNFVDHRNSTNLSLTRGKMAEPTYFYRNCAIVFGWVFHRPCKSLRPFTFFTNIYAVFFYSPLLFFLHNQTFPVWNSLSIYMEKLFSQNIRDEDSI